MKNFKLAIEANKVKVIQHTFHLTGYYNAMPLDLKKKQFLSFTTNQLSTTSMTSSLKEKTSSQLGKDIIDD